uniref:Cytochrome P450 n=1 Tax=Fagus sylvatica TaxID=28930 RepID=A0A2N9GDK9_FAGSY
METETWLIILISLCVSAILRFLLNSNSNKKLPPGPFTIPILGNLLWLLKPFSELEPILRNLQAKYGPIVTLRIGSRPAIFISNRSIAHQALVQNGAVFADRPPPLPTNDHLQYSMFCLLVLMCFGDKLGESKIHEIEEVQRSLLLSFDRFSILNFWPSIGKIIFRNRWEELFELRRNQASVLMPLIEARRKVKQERASKAIEDKHDDEFVVSYVDTLLDLELPEEKRKLQGDEMISLCSEFLDAGTDTTSTALQWIMANLVKYPHIQERLFVEIKGVMGDGEKVKEVKEEDLNKMPYLKAVVLEGLRRHPPGHFVLPHAVTEDVVLDGYLVPKNATLNIMVAEMGWDPKVWEDPMAFKPERFLIGGGDVMVMWRAVDGDGDGVDLSEKQEFTMVMKYPLKAHLSPRL